MVILKQYFKMALFAAGLYLLLNIFHFFIGGGFDKSYGAYIIEFLIFGGFFSAIMVTLQVSNLKDLGLTGFTDEDLKAKQSINLISQIGPDDFITELKKESEFKRATFITDENTIHIRVPMNWYTWGEIVKVVITNPSPDQYHYNIISKPRFSFQIFDSGSNRIKIEKMKRALT